MMLSVTFVVCLIVSNLVEMKTISLRWFTITAGVIVFPISYIINDCVVEIYGFRKARLMIWTGFAMSALVALLLNVAIWLPGSAEWTHQEAMKVIYSSVPRIMGASFAAFICGSMVNALVMSRMKARAMKTHTASAAQKVDTAEFQTGHSATAQASHAPGNSRRSFSARAIASTLCGETIDSLIFFPVAFAGTLPWSVIFSLIVTQAMLKTVYEIIALPLTILAVGRLKRLEQLDTVDSHISYSWWRLRDI